MGYLVFKDENSIVEIHGENLLDDVVDKIDSHGECGKYVIYPIEQTVPPIAEPDFILYMDDNPYCVIIRGEANVGELIDAVDTNDWYGNGYMLKPYYWIEEKKEEPKDELTDSISSQRTVDQTPVNKR